MEPLLYTDRDQEVIKIKASKTIVSMKNQKKKEEKTDSEAVVTTEL